MLLYTIDLIYELLIAASTSTSLYVQLISSNLYFYFTKCYPCTERTQMIFLFFVMMYRINNILLNYFKLAPNKFLSSNSFPNEHLWFYAIAPCSHWNLPVFFTSLVLHHRKYWRVPLSLGQNFFNLHKEFDRSFMHDLFTC